MSAHELLSLLRNGSADAAAVPEPSVSPSQDQQQFPPVPPPPPPPNVPLDLLFKDLGIAPSSAGPEAPTNSSTMNEQSANLLSLLQGALNPQATPSTSDSPQHRDLSGLTKDLDDSETHSQQSQTGLNHLFHTAPNTNRSSPAAASQT